MSTYEESKKALIMKMHEKREMRKKRKLRRKILSLVTVFTILTASAGGVITASAKEINITTVNEFDGTTESKKVYTLTDKSVKEILDKENVDIDDTDKINMPIETTITSDYEIVITKGKEVTLIADGVQSNIVVTKPDVKEALAETGFVASDADEINLDAENLKDASKIEVVSVTNAEDVQTESIPRGVKYVDDATLAKGETKVTNEGRDGIREIKYMVTYRAGIEASREVISDTVTAEAEDKVVAVGTKLPDPTPAPTAAPKAAGTSKSIPASGSKVFDEAGVINGLSYSKKITMTATAYSTHPSENGGYSVSAKGNPLGHGIVAVDPSVIPLGSKVYVTSADGSWTYGYASAEDTGGAIKGNKIDLCYEGSVSSVNQFGRRSCVVYVLN